MSDVNRQWLLASRPEGMVSEANFEYRESPVPSPGPGEILVRNLYLAFDPAMRGWMMDQPSYIPPVEIGAVMRGSTVGQVVASNDPGFQPGDLVTGFAGWQDYFTSGQALMPPQKIPDGTPLTWPLGVLGITGLTAYFGLLDLGEPKQGETVLVSGAAGATGSVAGQIAKIQGCRVVGIAGGPAKCRWLTEDAHFDAAIDYKADAVGAKIAELCPDGVDVYFDNVGGDILDAALANLAQNARVVLCGGISGYNEKEPPPGPRNLMNLVVQRGRMQGFIVLDYLARFPEAVERLTEWVKQGKVTHAEDIQEGLENAPQTFLRLFQGRNLGKQLLKIADPPLPG